MQLGSHIIFTSLYIDNGTRIVDVHVWSQTVNHDRPGPTGHSTVYIWSVGYTMVSVVTIDCGLRLSPISQLINSKGVSISDVYFS